jgi:hypothetical protein
MAVFSIPDPVYTRIMSSMGFPIVSEDDLGVSKDFIVDTLIYPAVLYYFKFFPKKEKLIYQVDMNFQIPFPDDSTIGVLDARLNSNVLGGGTHIMNPLINEANITAVSTGGSRGMWGTGNDYGYGMARTAKSFERQGIIENTRTFRINVDESNRLVDGFSNIFGRLQVTWAKSSSDWADVSFRRQEETIDLAKAYVLRYFGELRNQATSQLPTEMTGDGLLTRSDALQEKIETLWTEFSKVVIMRG